MLHKPLRDHLGHDLMGVVDALAALVSERIGERVRQIRRIGGREQVSERSKNMRGAILLAAILLAPPVMADSPDISARRLLAEWNGQDPMTRKLAEVIASAFSSGVSWAATIGGKQIYCPPPGLKGGEVMSAFERFLADNPETAEKPYGDAMAATLARTFPCHAQ